MPTFSVDDELYDAIAADQRPGESKGATLRRLLGLAPARIPRATSEGAVIPAESRASRLPFTDP